MKTGINYLKISTTLTPKERAILVIKLSIQGMLDVYPDLAKPISTESEIRKIIASCPSSQVSEYNFLIGMRDYVWDRLLPLLELSVHELEILVCRFHIYSLTIVRNEVDLSVILDYSMMKAFSCRVKNELIEIANYKATIEAIQDRYFGGLKLLDDNISSPLGTMAKIQPKLDELLGEYNNSVTIYSLMAKLNKKDTSAISFTEPKLENYIDTIAVDQKVDNAAKIAGRKR